MIGHIDIQINQKYSKVDFGGTEIKMQVGSCANVTLINTETWRKIGSPVLDKASVVLRMDPRLW